MVESSFEYRWSSASACYATLLEPIKPQNWKQFLEQSLGDLEVKTIREALQRGQLTGKSKFTDEIQQKINIRVSNRKPRTPDEKFIFGGKEFDQNPNNWNMDQYWIAKDNATTLYSSTWDANTIELKISEAWKNGVNELPSKSTEGQTVLIGYTNDGIPIQFAVENTPPSVFANFDYIK